jgi:hypothetical protein
VRDVNLDVGRAKCSGSSGRTAPAIDTLKILSRITGPPKGIRLKGRTASLLESHRLSPGADRP